MYLRREKCIIVSQINLNINLFNDPEVWEPRFRMILWQLNSRKPTNKEDFQNIGLYNGYHVVLGLFS